MFLKTPWRRSSVASAAKEDDKWIADPRDILLAPVVSEKSYGLLDENRKYVHSCAATPTRHRIKIAVEQVFGVRVTSVNCEPQQQDHYAGGHGQAPDTKRAIVSVAPGDRIGIFGGRSPAGGGGAQDKDETAVGIRKYKPTTPGGAGSSSNRLRRITRSTPEGPAQAPEQVRQTQRVRAHHHPHHGGGHKLQYRVIDFAGPTRTVCRPRSRRSVRPQPHRSHRAAALRRRHQAPYILAPTEAQKQGDRVRTETEHTDIKPGNNLPLRNIPTGTVVRGGATPRRQRQIARSAGASIAAGGMDGPYAQLRMPSGEIRNVDLRCRATVGEMGNAEQSNINWGKGRPDALEGQAPDRPRRRDEPGRPPAQRRRGKTSR